MNLFLRLNGLKLAADPASATQTFFALAAGRLGIGCLTGWVAARLTPA